MEKNDFQTAVARAEAKYGAAWESMSPAARSDAIYRELSELDRQTVIQRRHETE
jgi:hypothetical protein